MCTVQKVKGGTGAGIFSGGFSTTRLFNKLQCFLQQRQSLASAMSNRTRSLEKQLLNF
jgi:hypothetical protein